MPGPKKGTIRLTAEHRDKISNSKILQRLIRHAEGGDDNMTQSQVTASIALLKKVLPDLSATTVSGDDDAPLVHKITREIVRPKNSDS